ncbi:MAG: penicillin acylase family protein, partial [Flavobacteriales bacterium]|nr:penicillin acylase family protein [Flavobacteriales bacterium]
MKNVLKALGLLLVLLILCTLGFVQSSGTNYSFTLQSDAVSAPVNIVFDDMAVPHIYADSENDAMYALGYVHAAERLWQMDLLRRAGGGELSALLGPDMIENDQYLRTLGMNEAAKGVAEDFLTRAPVRIQSAMAAYLKGINRFIAEGDTPLEYRLLGTEPEPFDTHDVYCATGFMAYSFAIHLKTEPILDWMKQNLGPAYMADLALGPDGFTRIPVFGTPPDTLITPQTPDETVHMSAPVQRQDLTSIASTAHRLDALRPVPQWLGSNAWVIGGDKTASGKVIFCNDAHMGYAQPSVWYEAHIVTPE